MGSFAELVKSQSLEELADLRLIETAKILTDFIPEELLKEAEVK